MKNILNSDFTNWLLKWGLSRVGLLATALVTWAFTKLDVAKYVTPEDAVTLQQNIEKGFVAAAMIFVAWLIERNKRGGKVIQRAFNDAEMPSTPIREDGIMGNNTIKAASEVTGVEVRKAIAVVAEPNP